MAKEGQRGPLPLLVDGAEALGLSLTPLQLNLFERYLWEIQIWSERVNLSALKAAEAIQVHHFLDSLTLVPVLARLFPRGGRLIDIGSGAGFPGLPLRIVRPQWPVVLVEATTKKAAFLRHIVSLLDLGDVVVLVARAEQVAHDGAHREAYDVVVARAVAPLPALLELTLPFLRPGGHALLPKSKRQATSEVAQASEALAVLGGGAPVLHPAGAEAWLGQREIVVVQKVGPTPAAYPRRPGAPAKRPLERLQPR